MQIKVLQPVSYTHLDVYKRQVVDILMKMQGNEALAKRYLRAIQNCWNACVPLTNNDYATLKALIENGENDIDIEQYFAPVSYTHLAYKIVQKLNAELKEQGFLTISGRVNKQYFMERTCYGAIRKERL